MQFSLYFCRVKIMLACLKQSTYFHWLLNHFGEVKNILKNHVGFAQNKVPLTTFLYHCVIGVPACHFSFSFKLNEIELCWATFFRSCLRSEILTEMIEWGPLCIAHLFQNKSVAYFFVYNYFWKNFLIFSLPLCYVTS